MHCAISTNFSKLEFVDIDMSINGDTNGEINPGESVEIRIILFNNPSEMDIMFQECFQLVKKLKRKYYI